MLTKYPPAQEARVSSHSSHTYPRSQRLDLQMVDVTLRVLARPLAQELPTIYRTLGTDYDDRVLPSICNEILKGVVVSASLILSWLNGLQAQFTASALNTQ